MLQKCRPSCLVGAPFCGGGLYNLDAVPPIHVVSNHVDTDKLTTANGGTFT